MIIPKVTRDNWKKTVLNHIQEETWALLPYADKYLVSSTGKIKSIYNGKIMRVSKNRQGYNMINVSLNNGTRRCKMVHRLVLDAFLNHFDNSEYIYEVNHISANKNDNSLNNLEWTTRGENLQHARDMKLFKSSKGELNGNCKFKRKDIDLMKIMYYNNESIASISRKFNGNRNWISNLIRGVKRNE